MSKIDLIARTLRLLPRSVSVLDNNPGVSGQISYDQVNGTLRVALGNSTSNILATRNWVENNFLLFDNISIVNNVIETTVSNTNLELRANGTGQVVISDTLTATQLVGPIGTSTQNSGSFTSLSASSTVGLSPSNSNVAISPTGTGSVTINPATAGYIDNMNIGASTRGTGAFTTLNVVASSSTDALRITQTGTGNALVVEDSANPDATPFVVDANGKVTIGSTTRSAIGSVTPDLLVQNNTSGTLNGMGVASWLASTAGSKLAFAKSRSTTIGTNSIVSNGDTIATISFAGDDGAAFIDAASIAAAVDGTPGTNDMPGRLVFSTTADGASSPTERMRIDNLGRVGIGNAPFGNSVISLRGNTAGYAQTTNYGIRAAITFDSSATSSILSYSTASWTGGAGASPYTTTTVTAYDAATFTLGTNQTVTNLYGFAANSGLTVATNNYGFYSNIASGTGRWNFYANGTAANFFGGATTISTSSTDAALRITQTGTGNALVVEDSANPDSTPFVVDANGNVGIGTTAPTNGLSITRDGSTQFNFTRNSDNTAPPYFVSIKRRGTDAAKIIVNNGDQSLAIQAYGYDGASDRPLAEIGAFVDGIPGTNDMPGRLVFSTTADGASSPTERMRINNTGTIGIGNAGTTAATLGVAKTLTGATTAYGILATGQVQSDVTSLAYGVLSQSNTQATAFTLGEFRHFAAVQGTIGATSAITNQHGFYVASSLTGATNNYGFYSNIASGTGRWNFYANGTADNYFAGQVQLGAGTAAAPALSTTGDTNTGIFFPTADTIAFSEGGAEAMRIDSSGNVGIGTSSPGGKLAVQTNRAATAFSQVWSVYNGASFENDVTLAYTGSVTNFGNFQSNPLAFLTNNTERMRIDSSGNVGIGTSSPGATLDVNGDIRDSKGNVRSVVQNAQAGAYDLVASDAGKHIRAGGNVGVNSGIFSIGDTVVIYNNTAGNITITQGASVTLRLVGTTTTGSRTLAQRGLATILCVASNEFVVTGGGLT